MSKKLTVFLFGMGIAIVSIICFSPGILNLFGGGSIIKVIIGIVLILAVIVGFVLMGKWYLKPQKVKMMSEKDVRGFEDLESALYQYTSGKHFGPIAKTVIDQLHRLSSSCEKTKDAIAKKFENSSMSYERYYGIVDVAEKTAIENVVSMANRIKFFDEDEYARLEDYRNDNIPDDIQEKQIALYKENEAKINDSIAVNENLILKLNSLSLELTKITNADQGSIDTTLDEIEQLTKEVKYYT